MQDLETIDDDAEKFNIEFVKINNKRLAKSYGINDFPTLTFFKDGQIQIFTGENLGAHTVHDVHNQGLTVHLRYVLVGKVSLIVI